MNAEWVKNPDTEQGERPISQFANLSEPNHPDAELSLPVSWMSLPRPLLIREKLAMSPDAVNVEPRLQARRRVRRDHLIAVEIGADEAAEVAGQDRER